MNRFSSLIFCVLLLLLQCSPAHALTAVARDFDGLVTRADTVFRGTVTGQTSRWVGEGSSRHIVTFVTFRVAETYKGTALPEQTLRFFGGTVGGDTMEIPDMPHFEPGQEAVLFVVNNGKQFCPLVGISQGRFHVLTDAATGRASVFTDDGSPVVSTADLGKVDTAGTPRHKRFKNTRTPAITADDFRAQILDTLAKSVH